METTNEKVKCTNCKCWRDKESFVGKKGNVVKRCSKCREKDDKQKQKTEVKEKRNERQKEKQYYKAYREKKKAEDEEGYKKHNAEMMKVWRDNKKEHIAEWKKTNCNNRYLSVKQQARVKGIEWQDDMTKEIIFDMILKNCFYCDRNDPTCLNGIDRMDNQKGYTLTNCVPCCKYCNFMKKALDAQTFLERCVHISTCHGYGTNLHEDAWVPSKRSSFTSYKNRAKKKELVFEMDEDLFLALCNKPCYYCHRVNTVLHKNGVDRLDNSIGYTKENCVSCCSECNSMKSDIDIQTFLNNCKLISARRNILVNFPQMGRCYYTKQSRGTT